MLTEDLDRELDLVRNALSRRLPARPQLEVLDPVVEAVTVAVMNGFVRAKCAAKVLRHH
jgi:hypothetical protein